MMVKIDRLEIENVKRVKAVQLEPAESGLTVIGGQNNQGKTSVLDAIAWALGGDRYRPSQAMREGSLVPPYLHIVLDNGLVVERKGKNSDLKVTDPNGQKGGQQLLNEFVEELALNLPKFMAANNKEKGNILLQIIGVGDRLAELERQEKELYQERHVIGQIADRKAKYAQEMAYYPDVPQEPLSALDLIQQQQEILARNGENQRKREQKARYEQELLLAQQAFDQAKAKLAAAEANAEAANKAALDLWDESTEALERNIAEIEAVNRKVRSNLDKAKAEADAGDYRRQYETLSQQLAEVRQAKTDLLQQADLPLPGLAVEDGDLVYQGQRWDNMSGSDQLKVATAIVRRLRPACGFVLLDKLEQMDLQTLAEFGQWLEAEGLQAIATRVSTGGECSVIIEDGYAVQPEREAKETRQEARWKVGEF